MFPQNTSELITAIKNGKLVVLPTDTLYGIHASALIEDAANKVYKVKYRDLAKPMIVIIGSIEQIKLFGIKLDSKTKKILVKYWPGKLSVVLPCDNPKFEYLHRGTKSLAFRFPNKPDLIELLIKTGPLVSTSVNPEGIEPAKTIDEAKKYFGDKIKYYVNQGKLDSLPSTLISIDKGKIKVLRQGELIIHNEREAIP